MGTLPEGYRIRPADPTDLQAVTALLVAADLADSGRPAFDEDFVRAQWSRHGFDLATDTWLVVGPDSGAAAYAQAREETAELVTSWGVVHPDHRRRGIGAYLLEQVEERAAGLMPEGGHLLVSVTATDRAAATLAVARGYERYRSTRMMEIDRSVRVETVEPPPGVVIRGIDPEHDLPVVHEVFLEAFRGDDAYLPEPLDRWIERVKSSPGFAPDVWLLALVDDRPVGALLGSLVADRGHVNELGVLPEARGRGIGEALLRRSLAMFGERGVARVTLEVDTANPTEALRLYERVGMRSVRGWDLYAKPLGA